MEIQHLVSLSLILLCSVDNILQDVSAIDIKLGKFYQLFFFDCFKLNRKVNCSLGHANINLLSYTILWDLTEIKYKRFLLPFINKFSFWLQNWVLHTQNWRDYYISQDLLCLLYSLTRLRGMITSRRFCWVSPRHQRERLPHHMGGWVLKSTEDFPLTPTTPLPVSVIVPHDLKRQNIPAKTKR